MNDRQLRNVVDGLGGKTNGVPREDGYDITVASEIMAVLCLASDINRPEGTVWARIIIGYTYGKVAEQKPVTAQRPACRRRYDRSVEGCPETKPGTDPGRMYRPSYTADHSPISHTDVTP